MPFEIGRRVFSCSNATFGYVVGTLETQTQTLYKVGLPSGLRNLPEADLITVPDAYGRLCAGEFDPAQDLALKACVAWLHARYTSGEMCSLGSARVQLLPHQVFVAHRACQSVITRMLLADEVGLGKTIEAGLILKELKARGLVKRTLVVAPASLVNQWIYEMESKFNEKFVKYDSTRIRLLENDNPRQNIWTLSDQIVVSLQLARSDRYREAIAQAGWDLAIFDEAHHLRRYLEGNNTRSTHSYRLAEKLSQTSGSLLLLTATPIQLDSFELYSLVELLDPALFLDYETFELYRSRIIRLANRIVAMLDRGQGDVEILRAVAEILELVEQVLTQSSGLRFIKLIGFLIKFCNGFLSSSATENDFNSTRLLIKALSVTLKLCQINEWDEMSYQVMELLKELEDNKSNEVSQFVQWVLNIPKNASESGLVRKALVCQLMDDEDDEIAVTLAEKYGLDIQTVIADRWVRLLAKEMDRLPNTEKEIVNKLLGFLELVAEKMENFSLETSASERASLIGRVVRSHRLSRVMVRNRRRQVMDISYSRRAAVVNVQLTAVEREIYQKVWEYVLYYYGLAERRSDQTGKFVMVTFQRLLASSFRALVGALKRRKERLLDQVFRRRISEEELAELSDKLESANEIDEIPVNPYDSFEISKIDEVLRFFEKYCGPESKVRELEKLLNHHSGEKVLVYVQFIETQQYLYEFLSGKFKVVLFNGRMDSKTKDLAVAKFRDEADVLISTEAGGEGRNLQFCNIIVNFDLPWNPMKIEQRIGRVDRIGQTKDVLIYNFALEGTIEARILQVLQNRIRIFEVY
ncbi:MAG: SNF2-related protein [Bacillota bacterium]